MSRVPFTCTDVRVVRDVATVLGNSADATLYGSEFTRVQTAYNNAYFDRTNNRYTPVSQANIAMPLEFGIVPAGSEAAVAAALVKDIGQPWSRPTLAGSGPSRPTTSRPATSERPSSGVRSATTTSRTWCKR